MSALVLAFITMNDHPLPTPEAPVVPAASPLDQLQEVLQPDELKAYADKTVKELSARWKELTDNTAAFIRENPGKAVLTGLGVGFAIGLLFRKD